MENYQDYHERDIIKEKMNKVYNNKIINEQKYQKIITNRILSPNKQITTKIQKKEETSKNINNKTLTDWNKRKIYKRIIQNSSGIPKLYLKKRVVYDSRNISKKKNLKKNALQNSDLELELDKDMGTEEDSVHEKAPHMTGKKNYNYFFVNPETELKPKAYEATTNNVFDDKIKSKVTQHIFHRAKKYLLI